MHRLGWLRGKKFFYSIFILQLYNSAASTLPTKSSRQYKTSKLLLYKGETDPLAKSAKQHKISNLKFLNNQIGYFGLEPSGALVAMTSHSLRSTIVNECPLAAASYSSLFLIPFTISTTTTLLLL